ncbi:hypothetical protein DEIPH_ctg020orf0011 [Deinococcus phoenicis]|uniref:Glycosyl transferase family protein n=1 Tax=Deinococcus phoenicis TaxID=1476583 RepID=A0A016QRI4_9DEIO|nr:glycosyltransferase family 9 protein [Deinococcus phoenicis]EYB68576.1 hypothetical protein DEIPH_ctg020orf0011 [Deinococcus phoenicis]
MKPGERFGGVRRIAVLRANALGDYMFSLPALEALRTAYPQAEIVLLGQPWHARFLQGRPGPLDRVVAVPPSQGVYVGRDGQADEDAAELNIFFSRMRGEHFDLAVQLHGGGRYSNPFVLRLGARATVGLRTPDAPPLDRTVPYVYWQHEIMRTLEVVALAGAPAVTLEPRLSVMDSDLAEARQVVPEDGSPLVALHPGAGDPRRRWSPAHFAQVADALSAAGARIVLTGAGDEAHLTGAVRAAMRFPAADTSSRLSIGGLAGLLSRCALVVSNDSGPLHLGGAVGARTVGIYWCGNAINAGAMSRSRHRPVLSWRLNCPVCGVNCMEGRCDHRHSFVDDVTPAQVLQEVAGLLAESGSALRL